VNRYARTSPGQSLEIISIERPYSFFHLIETRFGGCRAIEADFFPGADTSGPDDGD
jgi:hypothetical protein